MKGKPINFRYILKVFLNQLWLITQQLLGFSVIISVLLMVARSAGRQELEEVLWSLATIEPVFLFLLLSSSSLSFIFFLGHGLKRTRNAGLFVYRFGADGLTFLMSLPVAFNLFIVLLGKFTVEEFFDKIELYLTVLAWVFIRTIAQALEQFCMSRWMRFLIGSIGACFSLILYSAL